MKILLLGGHGFLGKSLTESLITKNYDVCCLSRVDGLDLTELNKTKEHFAVFHPDVIINCAADVGSVHYVASYPADVLQNNIQMSLNIYLAAKEICPNVTIINPLSNCSYPGNENIQLESRWWFGEVHESVFSFANSKRMLYVISKCYKKQYGIKSVNFLLPNLYGPGDSSDPNKTHALNGMIIRMLNAKDNGDDEFEIWGSGSPVREWGYIQDAVNILIAGITIEKDLTYPVNMAQNKGYSIKNSAEVIADEIGYEGKLVFNTSYQDGDAIKILNDKRFRSIFPDYIYFDHKKGLRETVKYYKSTL